MCFMLCTDPANPKTDSALQCSGQVDPATKECWSGKAIEVSRQGHYHCPAMQHCGMALPPGVWCAWFTHKWGHWVEVMGSV